MPLHHFLTHIAKQGNIIGAPVLHLPLCTRLPELALQMARENLKLKKTFTFSLEVLSCLKALNAIRRTFQIT